MNQIANLIESIRNNPKDVRFDDACRIAAALGFTAKKTRGSHRAYSRKGEMKLLNFQNHRGKIPAYQAHQLIEMIDKYESHL